MGCSSYPQLYLRSSPSHKRGTIFLPLLLAGERARVKAKKVDFPLFLTSTDTIHRIREVLDRAGYTEPHIRQLLDVAEIPLFRHRRQSLPLYLWRTRGGSPLDTFI